MMVLSHAVQGIGHCGAGLTTVDFFKVEVVESTSVCDRRACLAHRGWRGLTRVTGQVGHKVGTRVQTPPPLPLLGISMGESSKVRKGPWEAVLGSRPSSASRTLLSLSTKRLA